MSKVVTYKNRGGMGLEYATVQMTWAKRFVGEIGALSATPENTVTVCASGSGVKDLVLDTEQATHLRDWLTAHLGEAPKTAPAGKIIEHD